LHSEAWHFSKLSSAFRHFECSLHVWYIWAL